MKTSLTRLSKIWHEKMSHLACKKKLKKATKMAAKEIRELEVRKVERKRIIKEFFGEQNHCNYRDCSKKSRNNPVKAD